MKWSMPKFGEKKRGLLSQNRVYIDLKNFFPQLNWLAGNFNQNRLHKRIEDQLSGVNGEPLVVYKDGRVKEVVGFSSALLLAPCEISFDTGMCLSEEKFEISDAGLFVVLDVKPQPEKGTYRYRATYTWYVQEANADEMRECHPMPLVENWHQVTQLLAPVLGVTRKVAKKQLCKSYLWDRIFSVSSDKHPEDGPIQLQAETLNDNRVFLDENPLITHPRCPKVYQIFPVGFFEREAVLAPLIDCVQEEIAPCKWDYYNDGKLVTPNGALGNYLINVFTRVYDDQESPDPFVLKKRDPECPDTGDSCGLKRYNGTLCFCTGLQGKKSGNYIYAVCSELDPNNRYTKIEWVENDYSKGRDPRLPPDTEDGNHGLPYPPNWTRRPEELICQYKRLSGLEERINFKHIFTEIDSSRFSSRFYRTTADGKQVLNTTILRQEICDAVKVARKCVQANYRCVIPGYYHGKITLQLPLRLDQSVYPNFYLVLVDNPEKGYEAPTILTPSMAYYNSRIITPQEKSEWENTFFAEVECLLSRGILSNA